MRANVGDRLIVRGRHIGDHDRVAIILAIEGEDGAPPYLVRWEENQHEGVFVPGSDAVLEHLPATRPNA